MNPYEILEKHYKDSPKALALLIGHSEAVAQKALEAAQKMLHLNPDLSFIKEAALLHDIGIIFTNSPSLYCFGSEPYIRHGIIGRGLLEKEGLTIHAMVSETHVGTGITIDEIQTKGLPLPHRDMTPKAIEEIIVCYADKFFSKRTDSKGNVSKHAEKTVDEVRLEIMKYGKDKLAVFDGWVRMFEG